MFKCERGRVARAAVAAGLGLAMSFGPIGLAFADPSPGASSNPGSTGNTRLIVTSDEEELATEEGSVDANVKVSIPVAIQYVADSEGNLVGPSNNQVKFVNHTKSGAVHVSRIAVQNTGQAQIVMDGNNLASDEMSFFVRPVPGVSNDAGTSFTSSLTAAQESAITKDQLGNYTTGASTPTDRNAWNIEQNNGALALNELTGRVGGFDQVDPSTGYQAGTIHWTVRSGTRAQADAKDSSVTIRYHSNNGSFANDVLTTDHVVQVLDVSRLPDMVANSTGASTALRAGTGNLTPPSPSVSTDGTVTSYEFKGWSKTPSGTTYVTTVGQLGTAAEVAGTVQNLYAIYGPVSGN